MKVDDLETPCLVLDRGILERNLQRMSDRMREHRVALRPHLKTAKSAEVASLATRGEQGGIAVSTLAEAEYFVERGFKDVLVAAPLPPGKLDRAARLMERGGRVTLICDNVESAAAIAAHPGAFDGLVEIDSGDHRSGVDCEGDELLAVGRSLAGKMRGVLTHAGHSYDCRSIDCVRGVAEQERIAVTTAASWLREHGLRCDVVSAGSTPTMTHAATLEGITEARPGVYMFQDLFQAEIDSCAREDIALTVLASVIAVAADRFVIDAGALALSKDRSTQGTEHDAGFGELWDLDGLPFPERLTVGRAYQEHGVVAGSLPEGARIGSRVRVGPNHACITAAAHDRYYVVDGGRDVVAVWDRINGW